MPSLTCYRVRSHVQGRPVSQFDDVVEPGEHTIDSTSEAEFPDFTAKAYVVNSRLRPVSWAGFVQQDLPELRIARSRSPSALVLVRVHGGGRRAQPIMFAFAFGTVGRFLLRHDAYERGYGLRTALNVIYPRSGTDAARMRAVDSKRRSQTVVRSRVQSSALAQFELFDVNQLRDVLDKAIGAPAERSLWGGRVSGSDPFMLDLELQFSELGRLCRRIEEAHTRDDYRDRFAWIDDVQPVSDPDLIRRLQEVVVDRLRRQETENIDLAPPEILDWDRVEGFQFHFDRPQGRAHATPTRPDLRITDYLRHLAHAGNMGTLTVEQLQGRRIFGVDGDGNRIHRWPVWKCLVAEVLIGSDAYVLDEGDFFRISPDYLAALNELIDGIPASAVALPPSTPGMREDAYNRVAADNSADLLLLDKRLTRISSRTTPVEICDLLSRQRQLIHVKRHLGSSDLSHLFAQGLVSADLLQSSVEFRQEARATVLEAADGQEGFDVFNVDGLMPGDFEVVYAIIERWNHRSLVEALPFFSKVNLREVATNLRQRGFRVCVNRIEASVPDT